VQLTEADIKNSPSIKIGGQVFYIPRLALKQNRVVVSALKMILPLISKIEVISRSPNPGAAMLDNFPIDDSSVELIANAVYAAITRARPDFARADFDDLEMGIDELILALPVVMQQSFAFMKTTGGEPAAPSGEPIPEASSTGTAASSESAEPSAGPGTTSKAA
jgi:hypothetical protein